MLPSEFHTPQIIDDLFQSEGLIPGRMISGSKSGYRRMYPDNEVYFNANIVIESLGKIWYGDLDIDVDRNKLEKVARKLNEPIYVLSEMDCRFGNETKPIEELIKKAYVKID